MPNRTGTDVTRDTAFWLVLLTGVLRFFLNFRARLGGLSEFLLCLGGVVGQFADGFVAFFSAHDGSSFIVEMPSVPSTRHWPCRITKENCFSSYYHLI